MADANESKRFSALNLANLQEIEELYARYKIDRASVDSSWRYFFDGVDFAKPIGNSVFSYDNSIDAYRRYGHLLANINPLGKRETTTLFDGSEDSELKSVYCSRIGFEYMDLGRPELEKWIQARLEPKLSIDLSSEEKHLILEYLNKSEVLESFLHTKYPGLTRFSLEGSETLLPMLAEIVALGADLGIEGFDIGLAHRGRLNVLVNLLNRPISLLFKEFEEKIPFAEGESGDVKYHNGFAAEIVTARGKSVHLDMPANSSCLESVDGVVLGQVKAKQIASQDEAGNRFCALLMHGDAALSGQGVIYETLQMSQVKGFSTGGTIHIAINNQIGYTTLPEEGRSTRYCTDIAKTFGIPVFHVNAEDPESCVFAARLAVEIRQIFHCDVFIDLNCYRKYGHNEGDEPQFTQPLHYKLIKNKKSIRQIYVETLMQEGHIEYDMAEKLQQEFRLMLASHFEKKEVDLTKRFGKPWADFKQPSDAILFHPFSTKVEKNILEEVISTYCKVPTDFHLHPKLQKLLETRKLQMKTDKIDWGTAECLCFGSIVLQGTPVRLCGQDVIRGTFSHRHAGWYDQENGHCYFPFSHLKKGQARFDVHNTILSEYGALAFEFGYSWGSKQSLVIWEAQYGDFDIGAQIPIDHYIVSAEQKWRLYSSIVLILPHAYEGAGPEHSSAHLERFLQLTANNNIQVVYPTTPAQMFHMLRRQALRLIKKPLIVMAPKSLLRLPACVSALTDFTEGEFQEFIDDSLKTPKRLFLCSGKIYYDLLSARDQFLDAAIVRVEQIYPFHEEKFQRIVTQYKMVTEVYWVQEEPENMGAWEFLQPILAKFFPNIQYVGRPRSASPATGSKKKHEEEQLAIINALKAKS